MSMCTNYRRQLEESLQDELCDAGFYAQIAEEAPTEELRELIISIVGDEYGHARLQASLLGVCPLEVTCPPNCPGATGDSPLCRACHVRAHAEDPLSADFDSGR